MEGRLVAVDPGLPPPTLLGGALAEAPGCAKCGSAHFRFVRCQDVEAWNERHSVKEAERNRPPAPVVEGWSVPEGHRLWGDQLKSWEVKGNVWWRKRGTDPPKAA